MSQDPLQALYSGIGGALLLHLTTIESIYPTVCVCADYVFVFQGPFLGEIQRSPNPRSPARRVRGRVPSQDIGERRQMV